MPAAGAGARRSPTMRDVLQAWLAARRGTNVAIAVPERGRQAQADGGRAPQRRRSRSTATSCRRASDFGARSRALAELAERLGLEQAPLRIECYDISNLGPTDKVGSMVVFEDGLPKRADYRRFQIKGVAGQDDFASMEEMLRRRFTRLLKEQAEVPGKGRRFSYPPALVVVDGGRGQLGMASKVLGGPRPADPARRPGQAPRGGLLPRPPRTADDPPRVGGAVRAAAPARRGAPVRHHLPPAEAREARARLAARRHPGRRAPRARRRC